MALTLSALHFLASEAGQRLLSDLSQADLSQSNTLKLLEGLRRNHNPDNAGAALTMARLRRDAADKFGISAQYMFFTADALQQASDPRVRVYRAQGFAGLRVLDAGCGIGSDALAMAAEGAEVIALEIDPVRAFIAAYNADALGLSVDVRETDIRQGLPSGSEQIFFDPARRDDHGRRIYDVESYIPPLSIVRDWQVPRIDVKLSPGVRMEQLTAYDGQLEFISVTGDLKEAVLRLGAGDGAPTATLLMNDQVLHWRRDQQPDVPLAEPADWLVEPDPSLLRAGLVEDAAAAMAGTMLDETIAYFTTSQQPDSPWVRSWRIRDWMPFHLRKLRAYLRAQHIGNVTIKKRGSPLQPETLMPQLRLKGDQSCTLVLTRLEGKPIVIICDDLIPF